MLTRVQVGNNSNSCSSHSHMCV